MELTNGVINRLGYRYSYKGPHLLNIVVLVVVCLVTVVVVCSVTAGWSAWTSYS